MLVNLGKLDLFPLQQSRAIAFECQGRLMEGFVVRDENHLHAYINRCPHTGAPLNWTEHQFLTLDGAWIQCGMHGALFEIGSGKCVVGPCVGAHLQPIPLLEKGGELFVDVAEWIDNPGGS